MRVSPPFLIKATSRFGVRAFFYVCNICISLSTRTTNHIRPKEKSVCATGDQRGRVPGNVRVSKLRVGRAER